MKWGGWNERDWRVRERERNERLEWNTRVWVERERGWSERVGVRESGVREGGVRGLDKGWG